MVLKRELRAIDRYFGAIYIECQFKTLEKVNLEEERFEKDSKSSSKHF